MNIKLNGTQIFLVALLTMDIGYKLGCLLYFESPVYLSALGLLIVIILGGLTNLRATAVLIGFMALEAIIKTQIIDFGSDSITYHFPARHFIENGGNLFWDTQGDIRIDSQPILPWLVTATVALVVDNPKIYSFGSLTLAFVVYQATISCNAITGSRFFLRLLALITAMPPIFWSQFYTGYTDYHTYAAFALLAVSLIGYLNQPSFNSFWTIILACFLMAVMKYQTATFFIILFGPTFGFLLWKHSDFMQDTKRFVTSGVGLSAMIAVLFGTIWLYGQNIYLHQTPFPDAKSRGAHGFVSAGSSFYQQNSTPVNFYFSIFSETALNPDTPKLKLPGTIHPDEIKMLGYPDNRFGGHGALFSLGLIISLLAVVCLIPKAKKKEDYFIAYIAVAIFALGFVFPGSAQARFYPIIQLVGTMGLIALQRRQILALALATILLANTALIFVAATGLQYKRHKSITDFIALNDQPLFLVFGPHWYYADVLKGMGLTIMDEKPMNASCTSVRRSTKMLVHDEIKLCQVMPDDAHRTTN